MSAASNPIPNPPENEADSPLSPQAASRLPRTTKIAGLVVAVSVSAWFGYRALAGGSGPATASASAAPTAKATSGSLQVTLRISGSTAAQDYVSVRAPIQRGRSRLAMTLQTMVPSGEYVKKGEVVARIESQFLIDHLADHVAQVEQADFELKTLVAQQGVDMANLRQSLRVAKANLDKAELDLRTREIRTSLDKELLQLSVDEMRAQYNELRKDMANQEVVRKAALRIQEIEREQEAGDLAHLRNNLERFTIRAPIDGLAVAETLWRRGVQQTVREGDRVGSGQPLLRIVNPSSMILEAMLNQTASSALRIGQKATIRVDAYPEMKFEGVISSIGAMAVGGRRQNDYVRKIPVKVSIRGSDPRLIPDLSASAVVQVDHSEEATLIPRSAIREAGGQHFVYTKTGDHFEKRPVEVGLQNNIQAAITSGLEPGQEVRLSN